MNFILANLINFIIIYNIFRFICGLCQFQQIFKNKLSESWQKFKNYKIFIYMQIILNEFLQFNFQEQIIRILLKNLNYIIYYMTFNNYNIQRINNNKDSFSHYQ
ncbi:hypothetical protein pb186bvf_004825 [Paramecium bursaria]